MNNKQLAALYIELAEMYDEDFSTPCKHEVAVTMVEKIEDGELSKDDLDTLEPIFMYGHIDIHQYLSAKKRFIWF